MIPESLPHSMQTSTLAQFGCGYWGPNLLRNFSALPQAHVKYVVDPSPERRAFVTANYPRSLAVDSVDVALSDPAVDAVIVATPASTHYELARRALEAGKHVLVEKPLAGNVAEAQALHEIAAQRQRILMVGHTFLYNGAVDYLKQLIDSGDLGQIYYCYAQRLNLGVIRSDINAMWNLAPHDVSIVNYLMGQCPTAVSAAGQAYVQQGIEDVVFMNMRYSSGVFASVHVSWLDPNKVRRVTIVGSKKMVIYDDVADDKIAIYDKGIDRYTPERPFDEVQRARLVHRSGDVWLPKVTIEEPIRVEAKHFLACIHSGQPARSDGRNGRDVVAVLEAATRSLSTGGAPVAVAAFSGA